MEGRGLTRGAGGGEDCPFVNNLGPHGDKRKLCFSLRAGVFCLDRDHRRGLYHHHHLQVSHFVLLNSQSELLWERNEIREDSPSWLSVVGATRSAWHG